MADAPSARTAVGRHPERGVYDRAVIDAILDEGLICHVGFVVDGQPFVIPTIHARLGEMLYLHGSPVSRMMRSLGGGFAACVTVTLLDGVVLARSVYDSSMNYRSVVVLGTASEITDPDEKLRALEAIVEHVARGRWADARRPSAAEFKATSVVGMPMLECSAKVRTGQPIDGPEDVGLPIWAGVVPLRMVAGAPESAPDLPAGIAVPAYVARYTR